MLMVLMKVWNALSIFENIVYKKTSSTELVSYTLGPLRLPLRVDDFRIFKEAKLPSYSTKMCFKRFTHNRRLVKNSFPIQKIDKLFFMIFYPITLPFGTDGSTVKTVSLPSCSAERIIPWLTYFFIILRGLRLATT